MPLLRTTDLTKSLIPTLMKRQKQVYRLFFCQARLFYNFIIFEPLLCERFTLRSRCPIVTYFCGDLILKMEHAYLAGLNFIWQKKYNKGTTLIKELHYDFS